MRTPRQTQHVCDYASEIRYEFRSEGEENCLEMSQIRPVLSFAFTKNSVRFVSNLTISAEGTADDGMNGVNGFQFDS